ncbi:hypothetical protein NE237_032839 [Protea cynaroides]|uniref:HAT C-terminal dimerisation domain-containing protein n=1 Tax=Protea cynaroides TaxID=273540 RepID=A0A9Q0R3V1_9MAGN|nr:hypothetical protein NE237_032839 [Protea cynaroides]
MFEYCCFFSFVVIMAICHGKKSSRIVRASGFKRRCLLRFALFGGAAVGLFLLFSSAAPLPLQFRLFSCAAAATSWVLPSSVLPSLALCYARCDCVKLKSEAPHSLNPSGLSQLSSLSASPPLSLRLIINGFSLGADEGMATPLNELTTGDIMEGVGTPNVDDLSDDGPLIVPPDSVEAVSSGPITYGKRKRRSSVWEGFKVIPGDKYDDGKERAECLKCNIVYRADTCINGTDWAFRKIALLDPLAYDMSLRVKNALVRLFLAYKTMDAVEFSTFDSSMLIDRYGKSQLDYYLEEPKLPFDDKYRQFDVLAYWRQNGSKYPDVAPEPVDDAEDVAMALGNVLITDDLPMSTNLVASTVPPSSFAATLMANG